MGTSLLFGAIASSALILGAFIGVRFKLPKRLLAILLSFAAGALITALPSNFSRRPTSAEAL